MTNREGNALAAGQKKAWPSCILLIAPVSGSIRTHRQHADTYVAAPESWPTYVLANLQSPTSGESFKTADQNRIRVFRAGAVADVSFDMN